MQIDKDRYEIKSSKVKLDFSTGIKLDKNEIFDKRKSDKIPLGSIMGRELQKVFGEDFIFKIFQNFKIKINDTELNIHGKLSKNKRFLLWAREECIQGKKRNMPFGRHIYSGNIFVLDLKEEDLFEINTYKKYRVEKLEVLNNGSWIAELVRIESNETDKTRSILMFLDYPTKKIYQESFKSYISDMSTNNEDKVIVSTCFYLNNIYLFVFKKGLKLIKKIKNPYDKAPLGNILFQREIKLFQK